MKRRLESGLWAFAVFALAGVSAGAAERPVWRVTLDLQIVSIPTERALKLVPKLQQPATFPGAFAEVQEMIARDEADLCGWPIAILDAPSPEAADSKTIAEEQRPALQAPVVATSDSTYPEAAVSETISEERYPTEFEPPQVPTIFGSTSPNPLNDPSIASGLTPTAIEERNSGVTLRFASAVVSEDATRIGLELQPESVRLLRYDTFAKFKSAAGLSGLIEQPEFLISKTSARVTVHNGERVLFSAVLEAGSKPAVTLYLLQASALRVDRKPPVP